MRFAPVSLCLTLVLAAAAPSQDAPAMIAEVVRTGAVIVRDVTFAVDASAPTVASEPALRQILTMLAEHEEWAFEVQVHTDDGGEPVRDQQVSVARAKGVTSWLQANGVAPGRLVARGYGSSRPLAAPSAQDARFVHDRLELKKLNEE